MTDYISREEALNFELSVEAEPEDIQAITKGMALYAEHIKNIPAADVANRKKGKWIEFPACLAYKEAYCDTHIVCTVCEAVYDILDNCTERFSYCPSCGAEMKGE